MLYLRVAHHVVFLLSLFDGLDASDAVYLSGMLSFSTFFWFNVIRTLHDEFSSSSRTWQLKAMERSDVVRVFASLTMTTTVDWKSSFLSQSEIQTIGSRHTSSPVIS